jgi:hypothetical protein
MPPEFSVVAIIAAYNEADIIDAVVRDLIDQGISVYLLDDGSTDGTAEIVDAYMGRGVIGIERLPAENAGPGEFALAPIVRRKAQLAAELDAHWFINHDADEFRESPYTGVPLKDAIRRVDALGYNAIDFASLNFWPTDDSFRAGEDVRAAFPFYSEAPEFDRIQIRCWKKDTCVDLESTGGHDTRFEGRKVFPVRFLLRHYPIRGQTHGERKVFVERRPRYAARERALGWHVQYDDFVEGTTFVQDPSSLTRFDPVGVRVGLSLRHRGVEALEQSLDGVRAELERLQDDLQLKSAENLALQQALERREAEIADVRLQIDALRAHLADRLDELAHTQAQLKGLDGELTGTRAQLAHKMSELASRGEEIGGLNRALAQRKVEVDNLQAAVADRGTQLDAYRRSLSWRWMAPARAIYRLLTGR